MAKRPIIMQIMMEVNHIMAVEKVANISPAASMYRSFFHHLEGPQNSKSNVS